jgi:PadR family transcriptional regulator, regulatory protein PadR
MRDQLGYATVAILGAVKQGHQFGLEIMRHTGLASGTVYPTLARAERSGLVRSRWEDREAADREARPRRRHYQLTAAGTTALDRAARRLDALTWPARRDARRARS